MAFFLSCMHDKILKEYIRIILNIKMINDTYVLTERIKLCEKCRAIKI